MSSPGSLAAALAQAPAWLQEASDPAALDGLLVGWAKASGWRAAGLAWPADAPTVVKAVSAGTLVANAQPPAELHEVARRVRSGEPAVSVGVSAPRVYVPFTPAGLPTGVLWAETAPGEPMLDAERNLVTLTARLAEKSPAVAAAVGPVVDPERLLQRLQDASVIAGRMAHDFDNILTGIIGFADLAAPMLPPGSQAAAFVGEVGRNGQRGIVFTQQLHQLSRSGQLKPNPGSVAAALAKEEMRVRAQVSPAVRVEKDVPPGLPAAALEQAALQVVLGHLLENAAEACTAGGLVKVSARPVELTDPDARGYLGRVGVGAHLEVAVTDNGPGIKPEVRRRLFAEPFYTTKVRHRGLGLAIVYRVLYAHRGGVRLEPAPQPGTGTVARVVFPLAVARPPVAAAAPLSATTVGGSTRNVL